VSGESVAQEALAVPVELEAWVVPVNPVELEAWVVLVVRVELVASEG
jgi:hypothetical protein